MPKVVSDEEREQVREGIYQGTVKLIRQKGVRKVTVDDIAASVGISKGAFYGYYPSKEVGLYEVIKRSERELFARMERRMEQEVRDKQWVEDVYRDVFLAPDSIILYFSQTDLEWLLRKLPAEYRQREAQKSSTFFNRSLELLKVTEKQMEVIALLTDCLGVIATNPMFGENSKHQAEELLIGAVAEYLTGERTS